MMFRNKNRTFIFFGVVLFLFSNLIFAEENNLLENFEKNDKPSYDENRQSEFVVIEGVTNHEFNPQLTSISSDSDILGNVYEGLFSVHPITLEPQYAIAKEYKISRDKKRWIITLRDDAHFSNGDLIKAKDVRDSWIKLLSTPNAPYASLLDIVRGAEEFRTGKGSEQDVGIYANDDFTLSIYLKSPANYLPKVLCHTAFSIVNKDSNVFSGAYVIDEISENKTVLKRNPYYWDNKNVSIEKVIFLQCDDFEERAYLYNTGKADWVIGNLVIDNILDKDSLQLDPMFGISFFFFKTSKNNPAKINTGSPWDYKEFRNAVLEALPWDKLRANNFMPTTTYVYPLASYPKVDGFDFTDPIEAAVKMKSARNKYNIPQDEVIPLTIDIVPGALDSETMDAVVLALAPIGVEVIFREINSGIYFSNVSKSDGDMFTYTWIGDFADPLTFLELFRSNASMNESGWSNREYDELLEKAAFVPAGERYKYLSEAEKILLDEGMVIPIANPVSFNVIDPKEVGGWYPNAFDVHLFKYIYKKKLNNVYPNVVMK